MSLQHTAPGPIEEAGGAESSQPHPAGGSGSLTRVTANFTPRAVAALEKIAAKTGDSKTDILNRSVMVLDVFLELLERGDGTLRVIHPDGTEERLRFIG